MDPEGGDMFGTIAECVDRLLEDPDLVTARLREGCERHVAAARHNRELLRAFVSDHGWEVFPWAA